MCVTDVFDFMNMITNKLRILIADDDYDDVLLVRELIRSGMAESVSVMDNADGYDNALEKVVSNDYDLCLFDFKLGELDGLELLACIRQKGFRMPVIMLTGFGDEDTAVQAMKAGATDYISKSNLNQSVLTHTIRHAIKIQEKELEKLEAEEALVLESRLLQGVSKSTTRLLTNRDFPSAINEAMTLLADAAKLDVACIIQHLGGDVQNSSGRLYFKWSRSKGTGELLKESEEVTYKDLSLDEFFSNMKGGQSVTTHLDENSGINELVFELEDDCSAVILPIFLEGNYWGFVIFGDSGSERKWSESENSILQMAAASFGGRIKSFIDEETINSIVEGTSGQLGDDFFQSLVKHLAFALPAKCAYVVEVSDAQKSECKVLSGWEGSEHIDEFIYNIENTPCEDVVAGMSAFYPDRLLDLFTQEGYLKNTNVKSYAAVPCFDSNSRVIGHIAVTDSRPMQNKERTMSILKLFAVRAGAELSRKRDEKIIKNMAYHDALTGLPNRVLLNDRMDVALAHARRNNKKTGVLYIDFDGFKPINDTLGHAVGDLVLQKMSKRFLDSLRREDTVARLGGDEFVVLLNDINCQADAGKLAQKLLDNAREPIVVGKNNLGITLSIGIALYPDDGDNAPLILKRADEALYMSKNKGRDCYQFVSPVEQKQPA